MDDHDEEKTREQKLFVRSGKSPAEVTNNRRLHSNRRIVLLKLITDRHEASRGISATAELLVGIHSLTRNSAVAKRPRDASCLCLASLQYVCFRVNTAYTVLSSS